ncbi:biotin/lipoyl-binding protein [Candidatus Protofrankia californiensis]|uniref:biotin/lipoyl-binding protein n=1 Tax=Candidatus Protofrankia californiensis TaxID=1839754 RepID=UPI00104150A5|nr:biotin/lipoyl-binding protein [Candidatus Protofrankia californiensis]
MADRTSRDRRHRLRRWATVIVVIVVVGGVGGGVLAATAASGGPSYRTAVVTHRTVEATLNSTGTVTPTSQASVSFPVGGRVAQVSVAVGQHVTTGDVLAELDTSSLAASLDNARSTLASAQAKLAADQASQTAAGTASAAASTSAPASASTGTGRVSGAVFVTSGQAGVQSASHVTASGTAAGEPQAGTANSAGTTGGANSAEDLVKHYQQQLLADQHAADTLLYQIQADLAHEQSVCRSFLDSLRRAGDDAPGAGVPGAAHGSGSSGEVTGTPALTPSPGTAAPSGTATATGPAPNGTDCAALLKQVLTEQETLNDRLHAVAADVVALDAAVAQLLAQSPGRQQSPEQQSPGGQPDAGAGTGGGTDAGRPSSSPTGTGAGTGGTNGTAWTDTGGSKSTRGGTPAGGGPAGSNTLAGGSAGRSGTTSGASRTPASAAQIAADQASVDAANAMLLVAQQSLDQARLISPISGLVAAVNIAPGQSVSGGSGTATIVVLNPGSMQVTTTASDSNVAAVKIGAKVTVTPDGTSSPLTGTVVAIGLLPAASTTSGGTASSGSSGSSGG